MSKENTVENAMNMLKISKKEWREKHSDFKTIDKNGQHWILMATPSGTALIPVEVVK